MDLIYDSFWVDLLTGLINLTGDIRALLVAPSYKPDSGHKRSDVREAKGTGYTAGGVVLTGCKVEWDGATKEAVFRADNPVWLNVTIAVGGVVLCQQDRLICCKWFGERLAMDGNVRGEWDEAGILRIGAQ